MRPFIVLMLLLSATLSVATAQASELDDDVAKAKTLRPVKVLARKTYTKGGKVEHGVHLGAVTNHRYLSRYLMGGTVGYHLNDLFSVEWVGTFSPDFGRGDWKGITKQMADKNQVFLKVSKLIWHTGGTVQFSPFFGKVAVRNRIIHFDLYGQFGFGVAGTLDDLETLGCDGGGDACAATEKQILPTIISGGGVRIRPSQKWAVRMDLRSVAYIEPMESTTLLMSNNLMMTGSVNFFLR